MSTSVTISDDVAAALAAEAAKRETTPDALAEELIAERVRPRKHRLSFMGMGASTSGRHARDDEEMLAEGFGRDSLRRSRDSESPGQPAPQRRAPRAPTSAGGPLTADADGGHVDHAGATPWQR